MEQAKLHGNDIASSQVSRSGFKALQSEGLIETKIGTHVKNTIPNKEYLIQNQTIVNEILKCQE